MMVILIWSLLGGLPGLPLMFMRTMYLSKVKNRIADMDNGSVITIGDFLDIANYDAVKNALSKLEKEKVLARFNNVIK